MKRQKPGDRESVRENAREKKRKTSRDRKGVSAVAFGVRILKDPDQTYSNHEC